LSRADVSEFVAGLQLNKDKPRMCELLKLNHELSTTLTVGYPQCWQCWHQLCSMKLKPKLKYFCKYLRSAD